ncbi:MAG TPA: hypothetical protein VN578_23395 [Candidatus Binatia bacterium]|nr:hypothetical protein [Candidatus Binatia bacterium]
MACLAFAGCLLAGTVLAQAPVTVTINSPPPGTPIPADFIRDVLPWLRAGVFAALGFVHP